MDNQHRKIVGYRELSQAEIELMNLVKAKGAELVALCGELDKLLTANGGQKWEAARASLPADEARREIFVAHGNAAVPTVETSDTSECLEWQRFTAAEPMRWAEIGKTNVQLGVMALVRAIAQPAV